MKTFSLMCVVVMACGGTSTTDLDGGNTDGSGGDGSQQDSGVQADSGGGACDGGACTFGLSCCADACKNYTNDPLNCGGCGIHCGGTTPMCNGGKCEGATCQPPCGDGQVCCDVQGPGPSGPPQCIQGLTCPVGCPSCG